jgi:hypothetical protein
MEDGYWTPWHIAQAALAESLQAEVELRAEVYEQRALLNTPELHNFSAAVALEAAHQRSRWGSDNDAGKKSEDWFWLLGYLGGKALRAAMTGDRDKALHHTISSAAALANWHASLLGANTDMRPGVDPVARGFGAFAPAAEGG